MQPGIFASVELWRRFPRCIDESTNAKPAAELRWRCGASQDYPPEVSNLVERDHATRVDANDFVLALQELIIGSPRENISNCFKTQCCLSPCWHPISTHADV